MTEVGGGLKQLLASITKVVVELGTFCDVARDFIISIDHLVQLFKELLSCNQSGTGCEQLEIRIKNTNVMECAVRINQSKVNT